MEFFKTPNFPFMKYRVWFFSFSALLAAFSVASFAIKGPNYGIDFTGGTLVQGYFKNPAATEDVRRALGTTELAGGEIQSVPAHNAVIIRYKSGENVEKEKLGTAVTKSMEAAFPGNSFTVERVEFVGPAVGRHLVNQAYFAIFFSLLGIVVYVAFRFKNWIWGVSGVFALAHDVFLTAGFMSVFGREISVTMVAALLTLAGYSINDTIVIFDRIRESLRSRRKESLEELINRSLNETLSRTIITSLTVFLVLLSLLFFGGEGLRDFSLAMTFGVAIGSYSTLFIATPLVLVWQTRRSKPLR